VRRSNAERHEVLKISKFKQKSKLKTASDGTVTRAMKTNAKTKDRKPKPNSKVEPRSKTTGLKKASSRKKATISRKLDRPEGERVHSKELSTSAAKIPPKSTTKRAVRRSRTATLSDVSGATFLQQVPGWIAVDVEDGIAVYASDFKTVHYFNHTAAAIFYLCKEPVSIGILSRIMQEEFNLKTSPEQAIHNTVQEMLRKGLVNVVREAKVKKVASRNK
jgi:hypothetical protein